MKRFAAILIALVLCLGFCLSGYAENNGEGPSDPGSMSGAEDDGEGPSGSGSMSGEEVEGNMLMGLARENFSMDDIPSEYLELSDRHGRVEEVAYPYGNQDESHTNSAYVYLPEGYDESGEQYNILYLLHAANGTAIRFLNPARATTLQNLLDHMIANGDLEPLIVVAATYFPPQGTAENMFLAQQVEMVSLFPLELVNKIIPYVEDRYRTYAETTDVEGITASRDHRGIAGFSLGAVAAWNAFEIEMRCFRWYLAISEASWSDEDGGITGIMDAGVSAQVLYNSVLEQGYGKDDFRLFVATGTDDQAFGISTNQMISLLEYEDLFQLGGNTSCSMMAGGTHSTKAIYTYLYHILPALFSD